MNRSIFQKFVVKTLQTYQKSLSPDTGILNKIGLTKNVCVFYPTCSEYTIQAVKKYGVRRGLWKGFRRVIRCHPWQKNRIDELI